MIALLAISGLADCYTFLGWYEVMSPAEAEQQVKPLAFRALELDDTVAETRVSVATWKGLYAWKFKEADQEHKKAISRNPKYALAHHLDSVTLILSGLKEMILPE